MMEHSISCEWPEGCSCGASEWNALESRCLKAEADLTRMQRELAESRAEVRLLTRCREDTTRLNKLDGDDMFVRVYENGSVVMEKFYGTRIRDTIDKTFTPIKEHCENKA